MTEQISTRKIKVKGIVQGVGFRPFVYGLAQEYSLTGWVRNSSSGVDIIISGNLQDLDRFILELKNHPPALSQINKIDIQEIAFTQFPNFEILTSLTEEGEFVQISPDMSICSDCEKELFDPTNRRFRYPFINCTNCGPRFSIIKDIPYDRPNTTMASFKLCPTCQHEYEDPNDRRFHAQPTACPVCGPQVWFECEGKTIAEKDGSIQIARQWLREGKIIAIKGLGGFHLACDASNPQAVENLRNRKKRSDKPFAVMAFSLNEIRTFCQVSDEEAALLTSPQHPIVLLKFLFKNTIGPLVAPGQKDIGFMLPYTPLHLLLLEPEPGFPLALVMTSGNFSEEPVAFEDAEALSRLSTIADGFLLNDRPIHMRVDDSVLRVVNGRPYPIRRSRGYAPQAIHLSAQIEQTLACGAELKNTFCLTREDYAFLSPHIGDLENYETLRSYELNIEHFKHLFRIDPQTIVADLHPDYLSTRFAQSYAQDHSLELIQVQHHHAHIASCLADNDWDTSEPVIGLAFDGTGLGTDGVIWGGEVFIGGYAGFSRRFHLEAMPLPGGDTSTRHPARIALAYLHASSIEWEPELPSVKDLCAEERTVLRSQLAHKINTPMTTSLGRLFDAVSAVIGVRQLTSYEGQAAIEFENICDANEESAYRFDVEGENILIGPLLDQIIRDWHSNTPNPMISARFHNGLANLIFEICQLIRSETTLKTVAFSGGVWQNITLLNKSLARLEQAGFDTLIHQQVPTNDGGICLGQAMIAAYARKN
ncbi:MAG: carbamoyltransferase HypF [Anaerolineaceae bacterium]